MIFRLALEKDFDAIFEMYMDKISNPWLTYDPMPAESFLKIFVDLLTTKTLYVVEYDNQLVATFRLISKTDRQAHTLYLGGFTVRHNFQGKGAGTKILGWIKEHAKEIGKKRIELTVDLFNDAAIALYKKSGYEVEGKMKMSYKLGPSNEYRDEWLMACIL